MIHFLCRSSPARNQVGRVERVRSGPVRSAPARPRSSTRFRNASRPFGNHIRRAQSAAGTANLPGRGEDGSGERRAAATGGAAARPNDTAGGAHVTDSAVFAGYVSAGLWRSAASLDRELMELTSAAPVGGVALRNAAFRHCAPHRAMSRLSDARARLQLSWNGAISRHC